MDRHNHLEQLYHLPCKPGIAGLNISCTSTTAESMFSMFVGSFFFPRYIFIFYHQGFRQSGLCTFLIPGALRLFSESVSEGFLFLPNAD